MSALEDSGLEITKIFNQDAAELKKKKVGSATHQYYGCAAFIEYLRGVAKNIATEHRSRLTESLESVFSDEYRTLSPKDIVGKVADLEPMLFASRDLPHALANYIGIHYKAESTGIGYFNGFRTFVKARFESLYSDGENSSLCQQVLATWSNDKNKETPYLEARRRLEKKLRQKQQLDSLKKDVATRSATTPSSSSSVRTTHMSQHKKAAPLTREHMTTISTIAMDANTTASIEHALIAHQAFTLAVRGCELSTVAFDSRANPEYLQVDVANGCIIERIYRNKNYLVQFVPLISHPDWRRDELFIISAFFLLSDAEASSRYLMPSFEPDDSADEVIAHISRGEQQEDKRTKERQKRHADHLAKILDWFRKAARVRFASDPLKQLPEWNLSGHSPKKGASKALRDQDVPEEVINDRCGWSRGRTTMQRSYSEEISLKQKMKCSRILSGSSCFDSGGAFARFDALTSAFGTASDINGRLQNMWRGAFSNRMALGLDEQVCQVLLASLFLHMPSIERLYGDKHILVTRFRQVAVQFGGFTSLDELHSAMHAVVRSYIEGENCEGLSAKDLEALGQANDAIMFERMAASFRGMTVSGMASQMSSSLAKMGLRIRTLERVNAEMVHELSKVVEAIMLNRDERRDCTTPMTMMMTDDDYDAADATTSAAHTTAAGAVPALCAAPGTEAKGAASSLPSEQRIDSGPPIPSDLKGKSVVFMATGWCKGKWAQKRDQIASPRSRSVWKTIWQTYQYVCWFVEDGVLVPSIPNEGFTSDAHINWNRQISDMFERATAKLFKWIHTHNPTPSTKRHQGVKRFQPTTMISKVQQLVSIPAAVIDLPKPPTINFEDKDMAPLPDKELHPRNKNSSAMTTMMSS